MAALFLPPDSPYSVDSGIKPKANLCFSGDSLLIQSQNQDNFDIPVDKVWRKFDKSGEECYTSVQPWFAASPLRRLLDR